MKNGEFIQDLGTVQFKIISAFIEDENNWYVLFYKGYEEIISDYHTESWTEYFWFKEYYIAPNVIVKPPAPVRVYHHYGKGLTRQALYLKNNDGESMISYLEQYNKGESKMYLCDFPIFGENGKRLQPSDNLSTSYQEQFKIQTRLTKLNCQTATTSRTILFCILCRNLLSKISFTQDFLIMTICLSNCALFSCNLIQAEELQATGIIPLQLTLNLMKCLTKFYRLSVAEMIRLQAVANNFFSVFGKRS